MLTRPDGLSCLMATGEAFETLPAVVRGPET